MTIQFNVLAPPSTASLAITQAPQHGTAVVEPSTGFPLLVDYTPADPAYTGQDSFMVEFYDADGARLENQLIEFSSTGHTVSTLLGSAHISLVDAVWQPNWTKARVAITTDDWADPPAVGLFDASREWADLDSSERARFATTLDVIRAGTPVEVTFGGMGDFSVKAMTYLPPTYGKVGNTLTIPRAPASTILTPPVLSNFRAGPAADIVMFDISDYFGGAQGLALHLDQAGGIRGVRLETKQGSDAWAAVNPLDTYNVGSNPYNEPVLAQFATNTGLHNLTPGTYQVRAVLLPNYHVEDEVPGAAHEFIMSAGGFAEAVPGDTTTTINQGA